MGRGGDGLDASDLGGKEMHSKQADQTAQRTLSCNSVQTQKTKVTSGRVGCKAC